jgi:hypothetical protein
MNLENIKAIVNSQRIDWERLLLKEIAKDKNAIPIVLSMLADERHEKNQLVIDLNFQLSRAHTVIEHPELNTDNFVSKEIKAFYKEGRIKHCFANMD